MTPRKPSIQSMGGKARRDSMTPKERSDSARKAVEARWAKFRAEKKSMKRPV
jgi:hypothetical protein